MNFVKKYFLLISLLPALSSFAQSGCTDYRATNFDPVAVINDGSCIYPNTSLPLTFKCYIDSINLIETSGIVNQNNNFWTHVDNTDNSIYRIDTLTKSIFQKVTINNSTNYDWEDITSDSNHIYVGDVGNNYGNRTNLRFYKVLKSDITPTSVTVNAGRINFSYSDQVNFTVNHNYNFYDCEAFIYLNDSIHMFTKGWVNRWTKHYVLPADTGIQVAQLVDSFNVGGLITSAAIQGDSLVVLLGLNFSGGNNCFIWMLNKFSGSHFFNGNKLKFAIGTPLTIGQTEGICFKDTNKGYITNEENFGVPDQLREFDINPYLAPAPPTPIIITSANSIIQNLKACSAIGSGSFTIRNSTSFAGQDLYYTVVAPPWISATPISDTIPPGDSVVVTLSFSSGTLSAGTYLANISIQSNDMFRPIKNIAFTLNVDNNPCMDFVFISDTCTGLVNFISSSINTATVYDWDFGDGTTSAIANPFHSYMTNGNYIARLIGCNASGCDTVTQNVQAIIKGPKETICYPVTQSYCCGIGITHFRIAGPVSDVINNNSNDASAGFEDFTCSNANTMITNYPYALTCTTALTFSEYLKVWLDMNNDGILDSVSEMLFSDLDTVAPIHSGIITVPALPLNVYGIPLRIRVASDFQQTPQPCLNPHFGQQEDYSVVLNFSVGENELSAETGFSLYPNPFTQSITIDYTLRQTSKVRLEVFNMLGEIISIPVDSKLQSSGQYKFQFAEQPTGIYFVKLSVNEKSVVKKIVKMN